MRFMPMLPLLTILLLGATNAGAISFDAKAVARFDVGYARCEQLNPAMRGRRDDAYLSLWRVKADEKSTAQLAALRRGEAYRKEHARFLKASSAKPAPAASSPIEHQCQALWAETQRIAKRPA
jgi:hypothetical protein